MDFPHVADFGATIQTTQPDTLRVSKSNIEGAGLGVFFNGMCKKGTIICGYGGMLRSANVKNPGHYSLLIPNTSYLIDSQCYKNATNYSYVSAQFSNSSYKNLFFLKKDIPMGYRMNRPPPSQKSNCKFKFLSDKGVMVVQTTQNINTKGSWFELYAPYNNKKV